PPALQGNFVHANIHRLALLPVAVGPLAFGHRSGDGDLLAFGQVLRQRLGPLAPDRAVPPDRRLVPALAVGNAETQNGIAAAGVAQFGIAAKVAGYGDRVHAVSVTRSKRASTSARNSRAAASMAAISAGSGSHSRMNSCGPRFTRGS